MKLEDAIEAHSHCTANESALEKGTMCGCFYCLRVFPASMITEWINDRNGKTAVCPFCGIDSVIGEGSGYPITEAFLKKMKKRWF